ncbi:MAG: 30S ribosomal protein S20 [Planctomycetes bacterium]|nr:30S ribosomal protein S20 [Planctomycetota bacterium]
MPHTEHAKKSHRKSVRRRERNRAAKAAYRTAVKKARATPAGTPGAKESLSAAQARLDKAAKNRTIHPNTAARMKSRLAKAQKRTASADAK